MKNIQMTLIISSILMVSATASYATPTHTMIAPTCLLQKMQTQPQILVTKSNFALIQVKHDTLDELIEAKSQHNGNVCGGFKDVTNEWALANTAKPIEFLSKQLIAAPTSLAPVNYQINYPDQVNTLLKTVNSQAIWDDLTTLTNFRDRYAESLDGVKAATWLKTQVETIAADNNRDDVSVYFVKTGNEYKQPSVVMKIGTSNRPGIVIGAHMDTLSAKYGVKPGADDDGSGSASVLEVARVLLSSHMQFTKPIYIIWYSAEEVGLIGSKYVVWDFKNKGIKVSAALHMDMTGYEDKNDPTMWLITDYVNQPLTTYVKTLIETYVKQPVKHTKCGYACSDHASWTDAGVPAACPFETQFGKDNPAIHTSKDTMDKLSLEHMTDFSKLGVAFAVELAKPVDSTQHSH